MTSSGREALGAGMFCPWVGGVCGLTLQRVRLGLGPPCLPATVHGGTAIQDQRPHAGPWPSRSLRLSAGATCTASVPSLGSAQGMPSSCPQQGTSQVSQLSRQAHWATSPMLVRRWGQMSETSPQHTPAHAGAKHCLCSTSLRAEEQS